MKLAFNPPKVILYALRNLMRSVKKYVLVLHYDRSADWHRENVKVSKIFDKCKYF